MSAEELKRHLKTYADEHLPGWEVAAATIRVGKLGDLPEEQLVVVPKISPPDSRP